MITKRGHLYETKTLKGDSVTAKLKPKYKHMVLLLDTVEETMEYTNVHAVDSLNHFGWCKMDDVAECLGREAGFKMVAFCEAKVKSMAKEAGLHKEFNIPEETKQEKQSAKTKSSSKKRS